VASIGAAAFIRYPDIISAQATLTSTNEPLEYFALLRIAQKNYDQVNAGQQVLLKFYSYPYEKYGMVKGRLSFISDIPSDSGYLAKVVFTNKLNTTYGKHIQFKDGLAANAEIITGNMSLLKRLIAGKMK
jgi:HlyD family secretion protein